MKDFLELLRDNIIVFDGAMGASLQSANLSIDDWGGPNFENCSENLLYTRPDVVERVHTSFLDVGCDVIETNSFGGSEVVLTEFGIADKTYDVNKKAAELAKRLANDYSTKDHPRFVAGSIGPGTKLPTLGHITYRDLKKAYVEQVHGLIDGGSDVRVLVLDGKILGGMRRISEHDFRTNVSRQARGEPHQPTPTECEWALRATAATGALFAGVDILYDRDGRGYVIEVNAVPGWKAFARSNQIDIADVFVQWLMQSI